MKRKIIIASIVLVTFITTLICNCVSVLDNNDNASISVKLFGKNINVYNSENDAYDNAELIDSNVFDIPIEVWCNKYYEIHSPVSINNGSIDISEMSNAKVLVTINISDNDSFVGKTLGTNKQFFFALDIPMRQTNSTQSNAIRDDGSPNCIVYWGEDANICYPTYSTVEGAKSNVIEMPSIIINEGKMKITIKQKTQYTELISITAFAADDYRISSSPCNISSETNWQGTIDVSRFEGKAFVLRIWSEDMLATNINKQYLAFK